MASVDLNALTEVQTPASTDNLLLFNETSNVATRIDYDKLAEAILNKTRSEIGGVSPISAIAALNSRLNNNGAWYELLGAKNQNGDYTLNDSYAGYKSVVVMLFGSSNSITSCIYPTIMLITAGYHPIVEVGSNKVEIVFTSPTSVTVSDLIGSVRIYGIR